MIGSSANTDGIQLPVLGQMKSDSLCWPPSGYKMTKFVDNLEDIPIDCRTVHKRQKSWWFE